jgi:hypothetical protein
MEGEIKIFGCFLVRMKSFGDEAKDINVGA